MSANRVYSAKLYRLWRQDWALMGPGSKSLSRPTRTPGAPRVPSATRHSTQRPRPSTSVARHARSRWAGEIPARFTEQCRSIYRKGPQASRLRAA